MPPKAAAPAVRYRGSSGPKADSCTAVILSLFDHLVGLRKQRCRHGEAERLGGLEVDR